MKTWKWWVTAMAGVLLVNVLGTFSAAAPPVPGAKGATKAETYSVVRITVDDDIQIVATSSVADLKKHVAEEDKAAEQKYKDDQKAASKNKEKFDQPKPVKRQVIVVHKGFKTEDDAKDWLDKHPVDTKTAKK